MTELHPFDELSKPKQLAVAMRVVDFCSTNAEAKGIAPVSIDEIMGTEWAIVATVNKDFAGYIRHKPELVHERTFETYQPIGTLVVARTYQGNGLGAELVAAATQDAIGDSCIPFAHCNAYSLGSFQAVGYVPASPGELPAAAVSIYGNQPMVFPERWWQGDV